MKETVGRNTYHWISEYEDIVHIPTLRPTISQHIFIHYKHTPNLFRKHTLAYQLPPFHYKIYCILNTSMLKNLVIIKTIKDIHCNGALDLQEFSPVVHMIGHSATFDTLSCVNHHQSVQTISKWVWTTRIQSSTSNSINEILVSTLPTFFLFFFIMEKEKKINSFTAVYHCSHRKSIRYSLWRPSLSPAYGHQKLDKPHGYTGQIQQQFSNHFEQLCPRVHICNFIINTVIKLPERSCTTWYNLILSKCRI